MTDTTTSPDGKEGVLLAYATQASQAGRIALHTAAALQKTGVGVAVQALACRRLNSACGNAHIT